MGSSLSNLLYHIIFLTKIRVDLISPELARELYPYEKLMAISRSCGRMS